MIINPVAQHMLPKRIKLEQMRKMSDDELLKFLSGEDGRSGTVYPDMQQTILAELHRRNTALAKKPHWTVIPSFILIIIGVVVAVYALPQVQRSSVLNPQDAASSPSRPTSSAR